MTQLHPCSNGYPNNEGTEAMNDQQAVKLWRCAECGKWSHAQRQPKRHQRNLYVRDVGEDFEPDPAIVVTAMDDMEPDTGAWYLVGWVVWCGPFAEYIATPVAANGDRR